MIELSTPKIYHITHINNLGYILNSGNLISDSKKIDLGIQNTNVGMKEIKRRRIEDLFVSCYPSTTVGQYVPFNFCPRSVMLYILHRGNHPDIDYRNGQDEILHIECDLGNVVNYANANQKKWVFTDCNAGAKYAKFYNKLDDLNSLNWTAINSPNFTDSEIKDKKQAEFLLHEELPISLIEKIAVKNLQIQQRVIEITKAKSYNVKIDIKLDWYF